MSQTWIDSSGARSRQTDIFKAAAKIRSRLSKHLRLSGNAEFRDENNSDVGPTNGVKFATSLDYNRGLLSLRAGWDVSFLDRSNTQSDSMGFYLKVIRRF